LKPLIKCANNKCSTIRATIGGFINSANNNLIYCEKTISCKEISINTSTTPIIYFNKGYNANSKPLIKCVYSQCLAIQPSIGYYLNEANNYLIYCKKIVIPVQNLLIILYLVLNII